MTLDQVLQAQPEAAKALTARLGRAPAAHGPRGLHSALPCAGQCPVPGGGPEPIC